MLKFKEFLREGPFDRYFSILRKRQFITSRKEGEELNAPKDAMDAHESDLDAWGKISDHLYNKKLKIGNRESTNVVDHSYGSVYDKVLYGGKEKIDRLTDIKNLRKSKNWDFLRNYFYGISSHRNDEINKLPSDAREEFIKRIIKDKPHAGDLRWYERTYEAVRNIRSVTGR